MSSPQVAALLKALGSLELDRAHLQRRPTRRIWTENLLKRREIGHKCGRFVVL